jgi:hypothetical protein
MTNDEILQLADASAPEMMQKVANGLKLLASTDSPVLPGLRGEMVSVTQRATEGVEKTAGLADLASKALGAMKGAVGSRPAKQIGGGLLMAAGASLGAAVATDLYTAVRRGLTRDSAFNRVVSANPDLKKSTNDKQRLYSCFTTLHRYAPEMAADPILAGALLKQLVEAEPQFVPQIVQNLITGEKNIVDTKTKGFGMQSGIGAILNPKK